MGRGLFFKVRTQVQGRAPIWTLLDRGRGVSKISFSGRHLFTFPNFTVFCVTLEQKSVKCTANFSPIKIGNFDAILLYFTFLHINSRSHQLYLLSFFIFNKSYVDFQFSMGGLTKKIVQNKHKGHKGSQLKKFRKKIWEV